MKKISIFIVFVLFVYRASYALNGATYPIVEPDMILEIQQDAKHLSKKQMLKIRKIVETEIKKYKPEYLQYLPPSQKSYSYSYDVVYTLPFDIPRVVDGKVVGILYPKGFTYHVLRYIPYDFTPLVIFDLKNPLQKEYVEKKYGNDLKVRLLSVSGNYGEIMAFVRKLKRPVFFDMKQINQRFNLKNTISIVKRSEKNRDDVVVRVIGMKEIKQCLSKKHKKKGRKQCFTKESILR